MVLKLGAGQFDRYNIVSDADLRRATRQQESYLNTTAGTIRAQSSFGKNSNIFFLNRPFGYQNHHFKAKKRDYF